MRRTFTEDIIIDEILSSECCDNVCAIAEKYAENHRDYEQFQNQLLRLIGYSVDMGIGAAAKAFIFSTYPPS